MVERLGWLLDVYDDDQDGLVLWLLEDGGQRHRFHQSFAVTFYAAGPNQRLRALWRYLRDQPLPVHLDRAQRRDLFSGPLDVLSVRSDNPALHFRVFREVRGRFPDLDFYDADIPIPLRYAAATGVFPLARCEVVAGENGRVQSITPLDSPWDLYPDLPPLRLLSIKPDVDPAHAQPAYLDIKSEGTPNRIALKPHRALLLRLQASLRRYDPDIVLTQWGDTWLFPYLLDACKEEDIHFFNPNRDQRRQLLQRQEKSFFTYGRVVYRGRQIHMFGRWHIDEKNAVMFGQYGLIGVFEQARVTGLAVQEVARKSPGAGITALQMQAALREGILVPYQKQQAENFKTAAELITADRGGLVYQPLVGLHHGVAEIDFVSMYPSIMVHFNISPETVGFNPGGREPDGTNGAATQVVPELGIPVDRTRTGLVPMTLKPLLAKRLAMKKQLVELDERDRRYGPLKARSAALKWLLVVCFGYLGYKNARFGRIESHEAVTAYGREALLRAKEAAEDLGYTVLHMYVDGLWVKRAGTESAADVQPLLDEVMARTGLPIMLEGIYRWLAFLPSRLDERVPVANRYFGLFENGKLKMRGIETRRHDTAPFVAQTQLDVLERMAKVPDGRPLEECLAEVVLLLRQRLADLRQGRVPLEQLLVTQSLSRTVDAYRVPSPAARAAAQLEATGKRLRPGQRVRFIYTYGGPNIGPSNMRPSNMRPSNVFAWDLPLAPDPAGVDVHRYTELLVRAASAVVQPLGIDEATLHDWVHHNARQLSLPFVTPVANGASTDDRVSLPFKM